MYCISDSLFDYEGYSISSKAFLPTVVDIMVIKKIRHTKGTFHAKTVSIKDRNGMNLTEAEDIKKRWQEYTELYFIPVFIPVPKNGNAKECLN